MLCHSYIIIIILCKCKFNKTFNNVNKCIEFVVLLYWLEYTMCISPINATLNDFLDLYLNWINSVILIMQKLLYKKILNYLDYINLSLGSFVICDNRISLINI